jgi:hypothetical protein
MRSIRRSLTLYFSALLGVGLGAVALLADRLLNQTLKDWEKAQSGYIGLRADERVQREAERFDRELADKAKSLGVQFKVRSENEPRWFIVRQATAAVGLGAAGGPGPAVWTAANTPTRRYWFGPLGSAMAREYFTHLLSSEHFVHPPDEDDLDTPFVQVTGASGRAWRSAGMGAGRFPLNPQEWNPDEPTETRTLTVTLPAGQPGRVAVHKVAVSQPGRGFRRGPPPAGAAPRPPARAAPAGPGDVAVRVHPLRPPDSRTGRPDRPGLGPGREGQEGGGRRHRPRPG